MKYVGVGMLEGANLFIFDFQQEQQVNSVVIK
jgi:hypothetical protein